MKAVSARRDAQPMSAASDATLWLGVVGAGLIAQLAHLPALRVTRPMSFPQADRLNW